MEQCRDTAVNDEAQTDGGRGYPPWSEEETPLRWLFGTQARAVLVSHAVERAGDTDISYRNKSEMADRTGLSRAAVHEHIDDLVAVGIYETRGGDGTFLRYRPNASSSVVTGLHEISAKMESSSD